MIRKITIALLSVYLLYLLSQSLFKLFEMDTEVISRYKQWAKVLSIQEFKTKQSVRGVGNIGYSTSWLITVRVKNKTPKLNLTVGPPPKIGNCIPIIANDLSNGNIIVAIDDAEWRYGTEFGICE